MNAVLMSSGLLLSVVRRGQGRTIAQIDSSSSARAFARHRPACGRGSHSTHADAFPHDADQGVRITLEARLAGARLFVQIDLRSRQYTYPQVSHPQARL